ncbi:hypothetical protein ACMSDR_15710 [Bacteroides thetaiotaomicron]|uniref:hypothetical protein n=1 Tax=Bacteroides thetaiotaomicron TaxID=818 RepID=UPI0039C3849F
MARKQTLRKRRRQHADSYRNYKRKTWHDLLSARPDAQTSAGEPAAERKEGCRRQEP